MKKILTVTLNPAVDKTYTTQCVIAGHVNRMRTVTKIAGGKGVNVTRILRQYGYEVAATGFLGGYSGRFIEEELIKRGAECRFVHVAGETRTNMNILADDGYVTELLEPGPVISGEEAEAFFAQYDALLAECGLVILSGSVAQGMDDEVYAGLIARASDAGVPAYLDSSGEGLRFGVRAKPFLIKPNRKELEYIMGHRLAGREEVAEAAKFLLQQGVGKVIVSMGDKGLMSVTAEGVLYANVRGIVPVNTVGCGDSVVASYAMSYLAGDPEERALVRACAVASANATTAESASIPMETAEELMNRIIVEKMDV